MYYVLLQGTMVTVHFYWRMVMFLKGAVNSYSGLQIYHGLSSGEMRREDIRGKSRASLDLRARLRRWRSKVDPASAESMIPGFLDFRKC